MFSSFSTALTALNATSTAIDVVGNNLANLNTVGFKESTVSFYDLVAESIGAGSSGGQVGLGTAPPIIQREFAQGSITSSASALSTAISGDGFFILRDSTSGNTLYTRAGDFSLDKNGYLLTVTGQRVQGWPAVNGVPQITGQLADINVPVGKERSGQASTQFELDMNLNASAIAGSPTGTFSTSVQVYDSLGNPQTLTATFTKDPTTPGNWTYQFTIPGDATKTGTPGTPTNLLTTPGTLQFDSSGNLVAPDAKTAVTIPVPGLSDGAADLNLSWNVYNPATGAPNLTQFSQASTVSGESQDGHAASQVTHVGIGDGGTVYAQYSDGSQETLGQIALAEIPNPESLTS